MCGIVGMAGNLEYKDKDAFSILLHLCELRGEDSTGVFSVGKTSTEPLTTKVVGGSRQMFDTTAFDKLMFSQKRVVVGHCRKATVGGISRRTAHPFTYGDITGVHNGTLRNWRYLPGDIEDTDSMTLYKNFAEVGVRETIDATDGAYALIWWDAATETLNVLRNNERPLYYCFTDDFKRIYWASEPWMLSVATDKAGVKRANLSRAENAVTTILSVEEDSWWRIKPGRTGGKDALTFLGKEDDHDEELKGGVNPAKYVSPPFQHHSNGVVQPWPRSTHSSSSSVGVARTPTVKEKIESGQLRLASPAATGTVVESTNTKPPSSDTGTTESNSTLKASQPSRPTLSLVPDSKSAGSDESLNDALPDDNLLTTIAGFGDARLTKEEFELLVDPNCIWCQGPLAFDEIIADPTIIGDWTDDDSFICSGCVNNTHGYMIGGYNS